MQFALIRPDVFSYFEGNEEVEGGMSMPQLRTGNTFSTAGYVLEYFLQVKGVTIIDKSNDRSDTALLI